MRRYLVIGHRTLGGEHLSEHLLTVRADEPTCEFHVLVPEYAAPGWYDHEIRAEAEARLAEMSNRLSAIGLGCTGEVGAADPVLAATQLIDREGAEAFAAIVLSTLPQQFSRWWNVADDLRDALPAIPLTHLVADRTFREVIGQPPKHNQHRTEADMQTIPTPAQALLGSDAVAHVWTNNRDGSPQVSVVWVIAQGDEILFGTDGRSVKARNLERDPRVILSIEDAERNDRGFQRHLIIRGTAVIEPGPAPELMDRLAMKYAGMVRHPLSLRDAPTAVVVRVSIDRISGEGPWVEDQQPAKVG